MKKSSITKAALLLAAVFILTGCGNKKSTNSKKEAVHIDKIKAASIEETNRIEVSYDSMTEFFNPTFEPIMFAAKTADSVAEESTGSKKSKEKTDSVIPGLRKLSDYKTKYSTEKAKLLETAESGEEDLEAEIKNADKKSFTIESWGPEDTIVSENKNPTFYVSFSQPVHKTTALEAPTDKSDIMTITPYIKGTFRWYGSKMLAYECSEAAIPSQEYTIEISDKLKALSGAKISGQTYFTTKAQAVTIRRFYAGYLGESDYYYGSNTGIIPEHANTFYVRFDYPVTKEIIENNLNVQIDSVKRTFIAEPDYDTSHFCWGYKLEADKERGISNSWIVKLNGELPYHKTVNVQYNGGKTYSYKTLQAFKISDFDDFTRVNTQTKKNPLHITFNIQPDEASLEGKLYLDNKTQISKENISVSDKTAIIFNLPVNIGEVHTINIKPGIKDIYGQDLYFEGKNSYSFTVSSLPAYSKFLDNGTKIMEAQFPHKFLFEYQNINEGSEYVMSKTTNPLASSYKESKFFDGNTVNLPVAEKDQRHFVEFNLDDYLDNGYGFVFFQADIKRQEYNSWREKWEEIDDKNAISIQVTDLGITARVGINKAVVWVNSLATGKPVANAKVELFGKNGNGENDIDNSPFASGTTGKDGLCVINFTENEFNKFKTYFKFLGYSAPVIKVTNGDDKCIFIPSSHYTYQFDIDRESYKAAVSEQQMTFMFVDRGVYKPGETVSFRGIDRNKIMGQLAVNRGNYTIKVLENEWSKKEICPQIHGTLSESGGFYGSFTLPQDIEPRTYVLKFVRDNTNPDAETEYGTGSVYFTVANFERLKFESSVTIPELTYYGGDNVNAEISADYLAGGALGDANYEVNWFTQKVQFESELPQAKDFVFGPNVSYSYRNQYSSDKGKLSADGKANILCKTEKITDGAARIYRASVDVTDISDQRVNAAGTTVVHPAQFYAGLKRNGNYFAEKGKKVDISYLLVTPDDQILENPSAKVADLEYKLTHTEWKFVHEQSVNKSVYTRYVSEEVEDASGKIDIKSSGSFGITPNVAGWYTLTVTGHDSNKNLVTTTLNFYASGSGGWWHGNSEAINLTASQNQYNPGDKAQLLMESPLPAGDYLITVEREGIFSQEIKHFDSAANIIEIPISKNYVPVVYVSVASYSVRTKTPDHQYGEVDVDKPKGYYGAVPLFVNPEVRSFAIQIECDKPTYRPGEDVEITLTATKGGVPFKNAELTLMAVDRGVLDLINYHVPDPINYFYSKYRYPIAVFGGDNRALLMDPVTYSIKDLAGGDGEEAAEEDKEDERKDFRPTAVFEPVLMTDENGKAVCRFKMPDSLTTYRITAFGVSNDLFALQEDEVKVQNPVNVTVVKPRKLRERDTAEFGVLITNLDKDGHDITVSTEVTPASPLTDDETSSADGLNVVPGKAEIDGETSHTVHVASGDSSVVYFDLAALQEGTVNLIFHVDSDILKEKITDTIQIEKTFVYETVTTMGNINPDESKVTEKIVLPGFAKEGRGDLAVTLDATRLGLLGDGVNYLFDYPYGCLEQQSSRVLPLITFAEYIDVFGLDSKVTNPKRLVLKYMKEFKKYQKSDGGFPYWPDGRYSNFYVSLRIAQIYQTGIERGYSQTELAINYDRLLTYIANCVKTQNSDYFKAHAAYILASGKNSASDSILDSLYADISNQTLTNLAYMGLAYQVKGDNAKAEKCASLIKQYMVPDGRGLSITEKISNEGWTVWENQSQLMALLVKFFALSNPEDENVDRLIYTLMKNQTHGYWQNTATTAAVLDGIYTYIKQRNLDATNFTGTAALEGKEILSAKFKGAGAKPSEVTLPFEGETLSALPRDKTLNLNFTKAGEGYMFYTASMTYALPDELQGARNEGLTLTYEIRDYETGELMNPENNSTNELKLESGKLYKASVKVESTKNREYIALRAPIPSGCEILDSTFVTSGEAAEITTSDTGRYSHWISNKVIYDNEIQFFWDNFRTGSTTVNYTFRASRRGVYPVPPVQAECMYEPETFGRSNGYLAEIK